MVEVLEEVGTVLIVWVLFACVGQELLIENIRVLDHAVVV